MGSIKAVILILASAVLVSCGMPEDNTEETLQGFWIESTGKSHAQVFGKTIIFSSILRSYPKRSFNIIPSGSKKYIVLDGKSSTILLKDNLLSLTVSGVFGKESKTFIKAPNILSDQLKGRFQTYVQYDEFHTDWSEIIERAGDTATVDQLILYHHNKEFRRERFSESIMIEHGFILITEKTQLALGGSIIDEYYIKSLSDGDLVLFKPSNATQFREIRHKRSANPQHPPIPEGYTHQIFTR